MAYISLVGGRTIEVSEQEATKVKEGISRVLDRPESVEIEGHWIKTNSIRDIFYGPKVEKDEKKENWVKQIIEWEDNIRIQRNLPIPNKIENTRKMIELAWYCMHQEKEIPKDKWEEYSKIATQFFEEYPFRTTVDSMRWLETLKGGLNILGERAMHAVLLGIQAEKDVARRDGFDTGSPMSVDKEPVEKVEGWTNMKEATENYVEKLREKSYGEDTFQGESEEIDVSKIPF